MRTRFGRVLAQALMVSGVMVTATLLIQATGAGDPTDRPPAQDGDNGELAGAGAVSEGRDLTVTTTHVFDAAADAYVNAEKPDFNYGSATTLRIDQDPELRTYVRFEVRGLRGVVTRATIEVFATSSSSRGFFVQPLDASVGWTEDGLRFHQAPTASPDNAMLTAEPFAKQTWVGVDVTQFVDANGSYSFILSGLSRTAIGLDSRESERPPRLTIETVPVAGPAGTPAEGRRIQSATRASLMPL